MNRRKVCVVVTARPSYSRIQAALEATNMPDTVYGPIAFEDYAGYQNQARLPAVAQQVQDGSFVTVFVNGQEINPMLETPSWADR